VNALYQRDGEHCYTNGFSIVALVALFAAILPNLPGFLVTVKLIDAGSVPTFFVTLYSYAWFVGFGIAFTLYIALRKITSEERQPRTMSS
jgi:NCS1 family nucleobase:cation symporter-1